MSAHVVLIDALNLIRRIYAVQERPFLFNGELAPNTQQQVLHNTVSACQQALQNIISHLQPTHALTVFDSEKPCFRYALYPDYKKGRAKMPEHLSQQLNDIQDVFLDLGVDSLIPDEDEADDVIATLSIKVALRNQKVTIVSTDKAFLTLLNENIQIYDYFNRRFLDDAYVVDKFQVTPDKLLDLWTLTGDSTNKIPGVTGIGQVTAAQLLQEYGSVAAINNADDLKPAIKKKMEHDKAQLQLSRQLLTLKQDIPLGFNLKDIRLTQPTTE